MLKRRCAVGKTALPAAVLQRALHTCHSAGPSEYPVTAPAPPSSPAHPARLILILSLSGAIGLGVGRFAYSLVLPDMRDSLHWSYSAAGFMNVIFPFISVEITASFILVSVVVSHSPFLSKVCSD